MRKLSALLILVGSVVMHAHGQTRPDTVIVLGEIHVEAARSFEVEREAPFSLFMLAPRPQHYLSAESLQDLALAVPGLWISERGHLALGERIVLRGASARSPFGTRGIQIFLDGLPLTMPDGQAITDVIDPTMVRRVQVVRGPAATFWGNASSGALFFGTDAEDEPALVALRTSAEGDLYAGVRGSRTGDDWRAHGYLSHYNHQGHREHSDGFLSRGGFSAETELAPTTLLRVVGAAAWQDVNSPGSLTRQEWLDDPTIANPSYVRTSSGKQSTQGQVGLFVNHGFEEAMLEVGGFGLFRQMENPLPYAVIDLTRAVTGLRANFMAQGERLEWSVGADVAVQSDSRLNFANNDGVTGETATLDQRERVTATGVNLYTRYHLSERARLSAGLRGDLIRFSLDDRLEGDDDQTGSRTFNSLSPSIGMSFDVGSAVAYASAASSFETPTTTELVNRPGAQRGFNPDLDPERTLGLEAGLRAPIGGMLLADASVYWMRIADRLLPYQTEEGGDRTFFRNADAGTHRGGEFYLVALPHPSVSVTGSYSFIDATFADAEGAVQQLPGVPRHHGRIAVNTQSEWWRVMLQMDGASATVADDANEVEVDGFVSFDAELGLRLEPRPGVLLTPFVRIENVFDAAYARSVVVNASFGRYFEPAPGRLIRAGLSLQL